jgi:hypothetical protein
MIVFAIIIATLSLWGVVASIVVGRADGYRHQPERPH